jgi:YfiH family protein
MAPASNPSAVSQALPSGWIQPDLGADWADKVHALMSARAGGVSLGPYAHCNLGDHVKDDPIAVTHNRHLLEHAMQAKAVWLTQVHGNRLVRLSHGPSSDMPGPDGLWVINPHDDLGQPQADGALTTEPRLACTVMVADCLPVLLAAPEGRGVAALHAGWRGLAGAGDMQGQGILHTGIKALCDATGADPADLRVWLGPCIGPTQFEVGADVLLGFGVDPADAASQKYFTPKKSVEPGDLVVPKWLADMPGLARDTLTKLGVRHINGGHWCTVSDPSRFFSFRRDGVTGRQAASISLL